MIRRVLDWLLGRPEPKLNYNAKARRLEILSQTLDVIQRGKR